MNVRERIKMKKLFVLFIVIVFCFPATLFAAEKITKDTVISDPVKLEFSLGGFDETSLSGIHDEDGGLVANYNRFDNPNSKFNSFKLYDSDKNHIYTISIDEKNQSVLIFSKDGGCAKIIGNMSPGLFVIRLKADLDFFGQPYELVPFLSNGLVETDMAYFISFEFKPVIKLSYSLNLNNYTVRNKEIIADKEFAQNHKQACSVLLLALFAFDEMMNEKLIDIIKEIKVRNSGNNKSGIRINP
jgi:hypothetical protein